MFCAKVKEFLSQNKVEFVDRNIAADEGTFSELEKLGYMTTPVAVIEGQVVVGFDLPKLRATLGAREAELATRPVFRVEWPG